MESVWRQFAVDLESVWRQHTIGIDDVNQTKPLMMSSIEGFWKHKFFGAFLDFLVLGSRPYGNFNYAFLKEGDQVVEFHPVDYINYFTW